MPMSLSLRFPILPQGFLDENVSNEARLVAENKQS